MNRLDEHLLELRLTGLLEALQHQRAQPKHYLDLSFEERFSLLVAQEVMLRKQRKIERLTKQANFRLQAHPEQMDCRAERRFTKAQFRDLLDAPSEPAVYRQDRVR